MFNPLRLFLEFYSRYAEREPLTFLKRLAVKSTQDGIGSLAAALSFYTALALAPLTVMAVLSLTFLTQHASGIILEQAGKLFGNEVSQMIAVILKNAQTHISLRTKAGVLSFATILFSAMAAFLQLRVAMNKIWELEQPQVSWWRSQLLSVGLVLGVGIVLLASFVFSTALEGVEQFHHIEISGLLPLVPFAMTVVAFTLLFKVMPSCRVRWLSAGVGAGVTAILFSLGKYFISIYLAHATIQSAYGAAGSLVTLLIWLYYSAFIFLLGAEFTRLMDFYARRSQN